MNTVFQSKRQCIKQSDLAFFLFVKQHLILRTCTINICNHTQNANTFYSKYLKWVLARWNIDGGFGFGKKEDNNSSIIQHNNIRPFNKSIPLRFSYPYSIFLTSKGVIIASSADIWQSHFLQKKTWWLENGQHNVIIEDGLWEHFRKL